MKNLTVTVFPLDAWPPTRIVPGVGVGVGVGVGDAVGVGLGGGGGGPGIVKYTQAWPTSPPV